MDEFNRQKRFNDHYFDTDAWEKQKAEENAKRKRDEALGIERDTKISKKDMVSWHSGSQSLCHHRTDMTVTFQGAGAELISRTASGRRRLSKSIESRPGCGTKLCIMICR
jgi:hypothetical protein